MGKTGSGQAWAWLAWYRVGLHPAKEARQSASPAALCLALMAWAWAHEGPAALGDGSMSLGHLQSPPSQSRDRVLLTQCLFAVWHQ